MSPGFIRLTLALPVDAEELVGDLAHTGILGASEEASALHLYWSEKCWSPEIVHTLRARLTEHGIRVSEDTFKIERVPDRDWNILWSRSVAPIRVGKRFLIRQTWNPVEVPVGSIEIILDPKRAFGTGFHATTQLLLEWLEEAVSGGERVLDVGTGSGILAMASLRLGAAHAVAIDHDPEAIECASENAAVNGFGPELQLCVASAGDALPGMFDLILANLDRASLLRSAAAIASVVERSGRLLICGIQEQDLNEITGSFEAAGCYISARRDREEWVALEIRLRQ